MRNVIFQDSIEIQTIQGQRISLILECSVDYLNLSLSTIGWLVRELVAASTLLPWPFTGRNAQSSLHWNNNFTYYLRRHAKITPSNKLKKHALDKLAYNSLKISNSDVAINGCKDKRPKNVQMIKHTIHDHAFLLLAVLLNTNGKVFTWRIRIITEAMGFYSILPFTQSG